MNLLLAFVTALVLPLPPLAIPVLPAVAASSDVSVVLHVDGLDDAMLARLAKQIGRDKNITIEYSCVSSDVLVLRFSDAPVNERADVITMVRRQLSAAGIEQGVEFLHIHVDAKGPGKC
jgi:hypothetical protein